MRMFNVFAAAIFFAAVAGPFALPALAQSPELVAAYKRYQQLSRAGKTDEAIVAAERTLSIGRKEYGEGHANTVTFLTNLARLQFRKQRYAVALKLYTEAYERQKDLSGPDHLRTANLRIDRGNTRSRLHPDQQETRPE